MEDNVLVPFDLLKKLYEVSGEAGQAFDSLSPIEKECFLFANKKQREMHTKLMRLIECSQKVTKYVTVLRKV